MISQKTNQQIASSNYISRDLSWLRFNYRVLDQARDPQKNVFERLKFLAITASNLDEFFMVRVGSLYNYLDYGKERIDYSGLREKPFRVRLLREVQAFAKEQNEALAELSPHFAAHNFRLVKLPDLSEKECVKVEDYFDQTVFPMLTPMVFDGYHTFPILMNQLLVFGVVTVSRGADKTQRKVSFVQVPQNLPRFYEIDRGNKVLFLPIEEIIRHQIAKLYRGVQIKSVDLFRITRNGDFTLEESDDLDADFIEELQRKIMTRRTGRVVRLEVTPGTSAYLMKVLRQRWNIDEHNIFQMPHLLDFTGFWQIVRHADFQDELPVPPAPVLPVSCDPDIQKERMLEFLKEEDVLLHLPFNRIDPVLQVLEEAAEDPYVLAIKITIYRLAKSSRVTNALLKAAENGKHVSVLFEVKARFDEENNIREAQRLQKAGCFVIYGFSSFKTHTKMMLVVRKEGEKVTRYVHLSSGNYNEQTARLYTDIGLLSTREEYANDVSEFFNVITGHSMPADYQTLITAPGGMRDQLVRLIRHEANNARAGRPAGIVLKVNSLEDQATIDELYAASQAGVPIRLIVRGICCLRPGRAGLSDNITVRSLVGEFLEHSRVYYFHNGGAPHVYGGSADIMNRSFDRRIESLFEILDPGIRQEAVNILDYNLKDNVNAYIMNEDGSYVAAEPGEGEASFNTHRAFYKLTPKIVRAASLFDDLTLESVRQEQQLAEPTPAAGSSEG